MRLLAILVVVFAVAYAVDAAPNTNTDEDIYGSLDGQQDEPDKDYDDYSENVPDGAQDNPSPQNINEEENEVQPVIVSSSLIFEKNLNDSVVLPCEIKNLGISVFAWSKGATTLYQGSRSLTNSKHIVLFKNFSLGINGIEKEDAGEYSCKVLFSPTYFPEIKHVLRIYEAPTIFSVYTENNKSVYSIGETAVLHCNATGVPKPKITWHVNDMRFDGETLTIPNINGQNMGEYRCLADNTKNPPAHGFVSIAVEHKPHIKIDRYIVNSENQQKTELRCDIHGYPLPTVNWQKDGKNIVEGNIRIDTKSDPKKHNKRVSTLIIEKLNEEDFGKYTCKAKNALGSAAKEITIVSTPAVLPANKSEKVGKDLVLTFKVESKAPVTEHHLQYKKVGDDKWIDVKPEVTTKDKDHVYTINYTLQNVESGPYVTRVRSQNKYGWSEFSDTFKFDVKHHSKHTNKKHHKDKVTKEHTEHTDTPAPHQVTQQTKESPVGASQTGGSSTLRTPLALISIAVLSLLHICRN